MSADMVTLKRILIHTTSPSFRRGLISTRDRMLDLHARWRNSTGWTGTLPDFIVVGTQKGGTTELYDRLVQHPNIASAFAKEVHYFDANYDKGVEWYTTFFPRIDADRAKGALPQITGPQITGPQTTRPKITGEASPCYLFHPAVARRVATTVPQAKIILMLRNPVDRAYSHYHHEVRLGFETASFAEAIQQESVRLQGERTKLINNKHYTSDPYMHYSYLRRGIYVEQLRTWFDAFQPEQILVLKSEDFFSDTAAVMRRVYDFLDVPEVVSTAPDRHKSFKYPKMDVDLRRQLSQYFEPYNQQLYTFLDTDFCWG
jgi:hypothetical protein